MANNNRKRLGCRAADSQTDRCRFGPKLVDGVPPANASAINLSVRPARSPSSPCFRRFAVDIGDRCAAARDDLAPKFKPHSSSIVTSG
jgi:hypothetical protein